MFKPDVVCTDNYKVYNRVIPNDILVQSKRYTHNIEAQNSSLRDFIKRVLLHLLKRIRIFDILKEIVAGNNVESRPKINEVFQEP